MKFIKTLTHALTVTAACSALLLGSTAQAQDKGTIGVSMPTKSSARWISDGNSMVASLKDKGYKADLQYADDDIPNQLAQVENMITKKVKVLVIAAIDGTTLSNALQKAADSGIKVIAYDRLIKGSKNVDYYATFDNFQVGVLQATSIVDKLGLKAARARSTSSCSAARPTTTTRSSSTTAPCRCSSPTWTAASWWCAASRWAWTRSARCAGTAPSRRRAWTTC
jgi:putative multiple sugar transport system substrate-binding protein